MSLHRQTNADGSVSWKIPTWFLNTLVGGFMVWAIWNTNMTLDWQYAEKDIEKAVMEFHEWKDKETEFHATVLAEMKAITKSIDAHASEDDRRFRVYLPASNSELYGPKEDPFVTNGSPGQ